MNGSYKNSFNPEDLIDVINVESGYDSATIVGKAESQGVEGLYSYKKT